MKNLIIGLTFAIYLLPNTILAMEVVESNFIKKISDANNVEFQYKFQYLTVLFLHDNKILMSKTDRGPLFPLPGIDIPPGKSTNDAISHLIKNKVGMVLEGDNQIDELNLYEIDIYGKKTVIYAIKLNYIKEFDDENFCFWSCNYFELYTRRFAVDVYTNKVYNFILNNKIPEYYTHIGDYVKSPCPILPNASSCYNFLFELEMYYGITKIPNNIRKYYGLDLNMTLENLLLDKNSSKQMRHFLHDLHFGKGPFKVKMGGAKKLMQSRTTQLS